MTRIIRDQRSSQLCQPFREIIKNIYKIKPKKQFKSQNLRSRYLKFLRNNSFKP